jgi:hypothetical protein
LYCPDCGYIWDRDVLPERPASSLTTRTLNPLPFNDLEPHRFEDLVRQLAYDFRSWKKLEAIGRNGDDERIDIRGIEAVTAARRRVISPRRRVGRER